MSNLPSVQFSSVAQSCPTLCDPMNRSAPGLPIHHQLLEFTQTHVHRVSDAIQPSHSHLICCRPFLLLPPIPPSIRVFSNESTVCIRWPKYWWCPCIESSLVLLEEDVCYDQCILLQNSISLCPASFCIPRPNLTVTPGVSWLPTCAFQSPVMKRTSFLGVSSKRSYRSS